MANETSAPREIGLKLIEPALLKLSNDQGQIVGVTVDGAINDLTEIRVRLLGPPDIDPKDLVGKPLEFKLPRLEGEGDIYGGEIFEVTVLNEDSDSEADRWLYDVLALPNFANSRFGRRISEFKQATLKDVLSKIAGDYSLGSTLNMADVPGVHEHLLQFIETDYDFFNRCLQRVGLNFAARVPEGGGTQLSVFKSGEKPNFANTHTLDLNTDVVYRTVTRPLERQGIGNYDDPAHLTNLPYGHPHGSADPFSGYAAAGTASRGIKTVTAFDRNYLDPNKATTGTKTTNLVIAKGTDSTFPAFAPALGQSETDLYAAAREAAFNTGRVEFQIQVADRGEIKVGDEVTLAGINTPGSLAATFLVVRQQLLWDWGQGVTASRLTLRDKSIIGPPATHLNPPYRGLLTGLVITAASDDPQKLGRMKVKFPVEPDMDGAWCRVVRPFAGDGRGIQFDPDVGDEVLVGFLHDDPDRPVVMGSLHFGGQSQPFDSQPFSGAYVAGIKMQSENELSFHEKSGEEKIYTHAKKDHETLVDNDQTTTVKNDLTIDTTGKTTIKSKGEMLVDGKGKITIEDTQSIEIKVGGSSIKIETAKITIKSPQIVVEASGQLEAKGTGTAKLTSSGMVEIQGGMVKIN